jgi:hypothetical protein
MLSIRLDGQDHPNQTFHARSVGQRKREVVGLGSLINWATCRSPSAFLNFPAMLHLAREKTARRRIALRQKRNEGHFDLIRLFEAHFHYDVGRTLQ